VRSLVIFAAVAVALALPASAGAVELRSGPLTARIAAEPFALEFVDRSDGDVLRSLTGRSGPAGKYGALGYSFDLRMPVVNNAYFGYEIQAEGQTVWFQATRLRSARSAGAGSLVLDVATDDPLGHRLEVTLRRTATGAITTESRIAPGSGPLAGRASLSGASFQAARNERYLGFGSRSNAVDQTGNRVFSWAEEGPFGGGEYDDEVRTLVPDFTFPTGPTTTNFPIPWLVSTRGLGFLIDQTERSTFNLLDERGDAWHAQAEAQRFAFTVFAGPRPADVVRRYSDYAGRQPNPRRWFFGPWVQFKDPWPERFRALDVPATVAQTYTHYLPCGVHRGNEARERKNTARHHGLGYKITTYFNPHICTTYQPVYDDAARRGLLVKNPQGEPYLLTNPFTADQIVSEVDFTHPGGRNLFGRLLDEAIRDGYDGWMEDFGEYTPTDAVFSDGRRGLEMHNRYPVLYHGASTAHTARRGGDFAVFIRSGFHGVQPHARLVWGGDPNEDWSCTDGLCAALHQAVNTGLSGIAYQGSDIGGFHSITGSRTSDELNARWLQLGAVSGVMRTQANGYSFRDDRARRSQVWNPDVLPIWRRYAKLRTQLYPYISAASRTYQRTGLPIVRHLALVYPTDRAARAQQEFMFGPHLLAAPVVERGARTRSLRLPRGRWVDLWRSAAYDRGTGGLKLGRARTLAGGRDVTLPAPLAELPLLARAGALLPLLPPDTDTLADIGKARGLVHLRERRYRLHVLAFPRGISRADLGTGVRALSVERRGRWSLRLTAVRKRHAFRLQASMATLRRPFRPCSVRLKGRKLPRRLWRYDTRDRVLHMHFRVKRGTLVVRRCAPRKRR
jgi:alpha-glucosidase (family GH31 glycosyl hydrolase)